MSLAHSPSIVTDGLVLCLDAANTKSYKNYNLATYSQDYANAVWSKPAGFITATGLLAPDGTYTATTLTDADSVGYSALGRSFTVPNDSASYNISIFIKKTTGGTSSRTGLNVSFLNGTAKYYNIRFNADTGVATSGDSNLVTSENNNYWRLSFTISNNSTGNTALNVTYYPATGVYNGGDDATATGSHTVWGLQVTRGTTLLPYKTNVNDSADIWNDLSGNSRTATLQNGVVANTGSFSFDGVNDHITIANSGTLAWTPGGTIGYQNITIDMWVRSSDSAGPFYTKPWNGSGQYNIMIFPGSFQLQAGTTGSISNSINFGRTLSDGTWTNIVCWADGTNMGYYINGAQYSSQKAHGLIGDVMSAGNGSITTGLMTYYPYGAGWAGNASLSNLGDLALTKVYNKVLTVSEAQQNFNAIRGRYGL